MSEARHILVVDDDDRIRQLVARLLEKTGYRVSRARDAEVARRLVATFEFDLAILDVMMPGEDGLSLLQWLTRARATLPVILLTAKGLGQDRIDGLRAGAEDYLVKPFEPEELLLRTEGILRRTQPAAQTEDIHLSGMRFDPDRGELRGTDRQVRLTEAETQMLVLLASRFGEPVSRAELADRTAAAAERSVDVQVTRLRRKIEPNPREPIHLQTVRGVGYRLLID